MRIIGMKHGLLVYASDELIAQYGIEFVRDQFGLTRRFPVKTDLSGNTVMVAADTHEEAVQNYLNRKRPAQPQKAAR